MPARPYADATVFRIDPAPLPVLAITLLNLLFTCFFGGVFWLVTQTERGQGSPWWIPMALAAIWGMTCLLFTVLTGSTYAKANRLGPWLIYDKATRRVMLPRQGLSFERDEIVHLQYITTKRLEERNLADNDQISELNLVTCRDGREERWPLLGSCSNVRAFVWLLKPLLEQTDLKVTRVKDQWLGWQVTESPYGERERSEIT